MKALTPWRPFRELRTLHGDIDDLFAQLLGNEPFQARTFETGMPAVESFARGEELVVRADLPGIDAKDVEISVEGDRLFLRGERKESTESHEKERWHREVRYGRFERVLALPPGVDPDSVKATYEKGILEITMKAPKGMTPKKIPISVH